MSWFFDWTPSDDPGVVYDTSSPEGWARLRDRYSPRSTPNAPFERVIEVAQANGVQSVVAEHRYIDLDYRNEHSRFYSTTFQRYPSVCHRLHFFSAQTPEDLTNLTGLAEAYCGYSVMRPLPFSPVGRTMLKPPPELDDAVLCLATDRVTLFGTPLEVRAVPFMSQDAQFMVCAHAVQWMALYHAHLHRGDARRLPGEIHDASLGGVIASRQLPSEGLTAQQMVVGLTALGFSSGLVPLPPTRNDSQTVRRDLSLFAILCRYVNSQMPPIVISTSHAWLIAGYRAQDNELTHDKIVLYRNDDAAGPYIRVDDPWSEPYAAHRPWGAAVTTLPRKVYLSGELSELLGSRLLDQVGARDPAISDAFAQGHVTFNTYCIPANDFKAQLAGRGLPAALERLYRLSTWPRFIWVVEAVDRRLHENGAPSVLGEAILDSTAHHLSTQDDPAVLALHAGSIAAAVTPDHNNSNTLTLPDFVPYVSGLRAT